MSEAVLKNILSKGLTLSAITKELGHCCCANLKKNKIGDSFTNWARMSKPDMAGSQQDKALHGECVGGVCEVTWKPVPHAA